MNELDLAAIHEQLTKTMQVLKKDTGKSRYPYYTETAADDVITAVHTALTECRPVIWGASSCTVGTLYNRFRQGAQYVTDNIDHEFNDKLTLVQITRIPKVGLKIAPKEGVKMLAAGDLNWRPELEKFIDESSPGNSFERINLPLSQEDLNWIESTLLPVRHLFVIELPPPRLLVVRINSSNDHIPSLRPSDGGAGEANRAPADLTAWGLNPPV